MFGVETDRRTVARLEREDRLAQFIEERRPVCAVALLEGINHDYAYKLLMKISKERGLDYRPRRVVPTGLETIPGLTDATQQLRAKLGDMLYTLKEQKVAIARTVGVPSKSQPIARDRPFNYDWSLSQIERLAEACGTDFRTLLLQVLTSEKARAA